jgi:hypothetical protein
MFDPAKCGQTAGVSKSAERREAGLPSLGASVGGDLETRADFDDRGRGPSHGILRCDLR